MMADDDVIALVGMPEPPIEACGRLPVPDVRQWRAVRLNLELAAAILAPDTHTLAERLPHLVPADDMQDAMDGLAIAADALSTWAGLVREARDRIRAIRAWSE